MKKVLLALCLMIALLPATILTAPKTKADAEQNAAYNSLYASYDWWKYTPPTNTYGTQTGDKVYWDGVDIAALYMYPSSYSGNGTLHSGSVLNWSQVNIYLNIIYNGESGYYYHRTFSLTKDGEAYNSKTWSPSDRTSQLLYSENLPQGNYTFTYVGAFTIGAKSVITFTYVFDFTIHFHDYWGETTLPSCTGEGSTHYVCSGCGDEYFESIPALGHNYISGDIVKVGKTNKRAWTCALCGHSYYEDLADANKKANYAELLFDKYSPYMIWAFSGAAGIWSVFAGAYIIIAKINKEKERARRMLIVYAIGLSAIFAVFVAIPFLIRGFTAF